MKPLYLWPLIWPLWPLLALISLVGISIHAQVSSGTPRMQFWALLKIALLGMAKGHRKIDFGAVCPPGIDRVKELQDRHTKKRTGFSLKLPKVDYLQWP